jgi:hypothetical protein
MRVASAAPLTTEDNSKAQSRKHLTDKTAPAIEARSKAFEEAYMALQVTQATRRVARSLPPALSIWRATG